MTTHPQHSRRDFMIGAAAGVSVGLGGWLAVDRLSASPAPTPAPSTPAQFRPSYAQCGEDLIVWSMFEHLKLGKPSYIDIGAFDPIELSNTYFLYQQGCRGVLVEPNVDLTPKLKKTRPNDTVLTAGIGFTNDKELDYYRLTEPSWNTFSKEEAEACVGKTAKTDKPVTIREVVKMPLLNINDVFSQHFQSKAPDFVSIDVEGIDVEILKTIDFNRFRPKVFCVETLVIASTRENPESARFLQSKGYVVRGSSFVNTIFIDRKLVDA